MDAEAEILKLAERLATIAAEFEEFTKQVASTYATKAYVQTYTEQILGELMPTHDPLTENSPIIGYVPLDIERTLKHFQNIKSTYTLSDYRKILTYYDDIARKANVNPYIAIAQMAKETDWGRSWWSQRPRRNPAGIGVTGETSTKEQDKNSWAFDSTKNEWKKGYSFPSWEIAAQAHIGHLLAYAYNNNELSEYQRYLVDNDPRSKYIDPKVRGTVKLLKQLDGKWSNPGIGYGKSIATLANALRT